MCLVPLKDEISGGGGERGMKMYSRSKTLDFGCTMLSLGRYIVQGGKKNVE